MVIDIKQFELDRIVTMLKSFGWAVTMSQFIGEKIVVTFEKVVVSEAPK